MKNFIVLCFLGMVAMTIAGPTASGFRCIMGKCDIPCPEGTHPYSTGCSRLLPEATCDQPHPVLEQGIMCDYSSCHCDPPTVKNVAEGKCVLLEHCPKKHHEHHEHKNE